MSDATFEKVSRSDKTLYGPVKIVLCGFGPTAQLRFITLLKMLNLETVPLVWAAEAELDNTLADLTSMPGGSGFGKDSKLPRAIIVSGVTENQLHLLMGACKKAGMKNAFWAALTPTSETWTLKALLKELQLEQKEMAKLRRSKYR